MPGLEDLSISLIIPAFNEEGIIGTTIDRVEKAVSSIDGLNHAQIVVVSDGSTDNTFARAVEALDNTDGVVVELISNVGSHSAIRCGLEYANGDLVVVMAADGQDPPETIPELVEAFRPGIDVVWAQRRDRANDPAIRRWLAGAYYWIFRRLTGLDYPPKGFDFVAFTKSAANSLRRYKERNTSLFVLLFNLGYGQAAVEYDRAERTVGESGWTLRKRTKLAMDMLTAFSASPIRVISILGVLVGLGGLIFGGATLVRGVMGQIQVSGWASLMVVSSLMGGLTLVALGFLGEYVWRTLEETRGRPLYIEARHSGSRTEQTPNSPPDG